MASVSKSKLPRKKPNLTRSGKVRIFAYTINQLIELCEKAQRPRDKHKFNTRIKSLQAQGI